MPISKSDSLFTLIKSLTRGEKRHFRSFAQRESEASSLKYLQLFEVLDKQNEPNETALIQQFDKRQLSNLKRHLYTQILSSLRLQKRKDNVAIQLREYFDFANILYGKGLYLQALKILDKAKSLAMKINDELILLQLLEFAKVIETRHITRSGADRVAYFTENTDQLISNINNRIMLSNLRISLHGGYIKYGHVHSEDEAKKVRLRFKKTLDLVNESSLGLIERAYYYQSRVWYHFILLEMKECFENAVQWLDLFKMEGKYVQRDTNLLMRAYHYILTTLYHLGRQESYVNYLEEFEKYRKDNYHKFNKNSQIISFIYVHNGRLNNYILTKNYKAGLHAIPKTLARIKRYQNNLDSHRILVLHYKIALLYIMAGEADKAIPYLNNILNNKLGNLREDIQGYARLAYLMAHYDIANYDVVERELRSIKKYFNKHATESTMPMLILNYFKKLTEQPSSERRGTLQSWSNDLKELFKSKYEKRGLLYLNIQEWVEKKH
ncbi:MAG: hypothetical protein AAGA77_14740 [Bacteroidota bacterium]